MLGLILGTLCLGLRDGCCSFSDLFPGCELTASTKSYTFQVDEEDDSDHILALSVVSEMRINCACPLPWWLTALPPFPGSFLLPWLGWTSGLPWLRSQQRRDGTVVFSCGMEVPEQSQWWQEAAQQSNAPDLG